MEAPIKAPESGPAKWLYGTFEAESPTGWMLELNRYLGDFQMLVWVYVLCAILLSLAWPVSWIVGIGTLIWAAKTQRSDLYGVTWQCLVATILGLLLCIIPFTVMQLFMGGNEGIDVRIEKREMLSGDVQAPWKAQMFLMLLYYFCVMYQDVNEQIVEVKQWMIPYLKRQVQSLDIVQEQRERITQYLKEEGEESEGDLCDLLKVLETMPGWGSPAEGDVDVASEAVAPGQRLRVVSPSGELRACSVVEVKDEQLKVHYIDFDEEHDEWLPKDSDRIVKSQKTGFFALIRGHRQAAHERGLFGLDIYTLRQEKYNLRGDDVGDERLGVGDCLMEEARVASERCSITISYILGYLMEHKLTLALVTILALARVAIPRLWLKFYLGGLLFPLDFWPKFFVIVSVVTSFITYFLFMALFLVMVFEYESNSQQLMLLNALVNMDARCKYSEVVLVKSEKLEPEESEKLMARVPLLNLMKSRNAIGFWSLRNYVLLDRSNDRVGMQILISISILLIVFNLVLAVYDLMTLPYISAFVPIVLFDVVVMGLMILYSLQQALYMNNFMASHVIYFNQAVHDIMGAYASIMLGEGVEANRENKSMAADLILSKKILRSSVVMVHENDPREALLFGVEVTPASLFSSAAGFIGTLGFFIYKMLKRGDNPMEDAQTVQLHGPVKFLMQYAAKKLL